MPVSLTPLLKLKGFVPRGAGHKVQVQGQGPFIYSRCLLAHRHSLLSIAHGIRGRGFLSRRHTSLRCKNIYPIQAYSLNAPFPRLLSDTEDTLEDFFGGICPSVIALLCFAFIMKNKLSDRMKKIWFGLAECCPCSSQSVIVLCR